MLAESDQQDRSEGTRIVIPKAIPDQGQLYPRGTVEVGVPDNRIVITTGRQADGIQAAVRG